MEIIILLAVIGAAGVIALAAFFIHRFLNPKIKEEKTKEDEQVALQQELDRVLEPIDDEEVAEKIATYKEEDDK
jgi:hypothetical protein